MTISSETISNVVFPENARESIPKIENAIISQINEKFNQVENSPYVERFYPNTQEREKLEEWRTVAIGALESLGCADLISSVPEIDDLFFYKSKVDGTEGFITGGVDATGQRMLFVMGNGTEISEESFRRIFHHEIAHKVALRVITLDDEGNPRVTQQGFERITSISKEQTPLGEAQTLHSKNAFYEPLADIFSYYCADEMSKENHIMDTDYVRETSFVLGMLDRMAYINNSGFREEFSHFFSSFCHRDFGWYKHTLDTFQKEFAQKGNTSNSEASAKANNFLRILNNVEVEQGIDVVHQNGKDYWGYNLTTAAKAGGFWDNYDNYCWHLVRHRAGIKPKDMGTWIC